jgi:hypothetical protein
MASGSDGQTGFTNSPVQYQQYQNALNGAQTQLQGNQLNQLLGGLLKQYQSQSPSAAAAPVAVAPPPPPPVANNQAAYTAPSAAQIPGMANLAQQVQAGTASPTAITAAGGPLQASTGSDLQMPSQYIPNQATTVGTQGLVNQSGAASGGVGSALAGAANIPVQAMEAYQRAQTLQNNGFGPAARSYSPSPVNWDPNAQLDGSSYSPTPAGVSGYIGSPSGASADNGGMDGTSGFIGSSAGDDASQQFHGADDFSTEVSRHLNEALRKKDPTDGWDAPPPTQKDQEGERSEAESEALQNTADMGNPPVIPLRHRLKRQKVQSRLRAMSRISRRYSVIWGWIGKR